MAGRRVNGEGTIYRRKDGRYEAALFQLTASGTRKRIRVYGQTWQEAHDKLVIAKSQSQQGVPIPDRARQLGEYLDCWLEDVIRPTRRPSTYEGYEAIIRLYLKPGLGRQSFQRLSVSTLQTFFNQQLADGQSVRQAQLIRAVLSSALTRAMREELVTRNVAQLVELPTYERAEIQPWSAAEATRFLEAGQADRLYPAFVLLVHFGLRRGEVLGLRWQDVDFTRGVVRIRQQLGRFDHALVTGPVKTTAGKRDLPLLGVVRSVLLEHQARQAQWRKTARDAWLGSESELVFTTRSGLPVDPRNLERSFHRICAQHGVRRIRVHDVRHTTATLLMRLGIPAREVQLILGHAQVVTTQQIYQHGSLEGRQEALEQFDALLSRCSEDGQYSGRRYVAQRCRHKLPSTLPILLQVASINSGGRYRARTCDLTNVNCPQSSIRQRVLEVDASLNAARMCWMTGAVAVSVAVKI